MISDGMSYKSPTLTLCTVVPHRQRVKDLPQNADSKSVFQAYVQDESNWYPGFIKDILFVTDPVRMDFVKANFTLEDFRPVLVDYTRFGICFSADLEEVVMKMGELVEATYVLNVVFIMEPPKHEEVNSVNNTEKEYLLAY